MPASARFDRPSPDFDSEPYWEAARAHRLLIKRCRACGRAHHYPRPFCPHCWSEHVDWEEASGRATLYTWSVVHRNDLPPFHERIPYVAAIAELEEGPRMMTNVVDCDFDALEIGMALEAVFHPTSEDVTIVQFRPASANS
jgi:hypothetical protein